MSPAGRKAIRTVADLLAHALALEEEAVERYEELADQMEVHHNHEVAAFFRRMVEIEGKHLAHINELVAGRELPHIAPWEFNWPGAEAPESLDSLQVHYMMRAREALDLALRHEQKAVAFYGNVAQSAKREDVRKLALTLAEEEEEHVRWFEEWLAKVPGDAQVRADDPDPPNELE